MHPDPLSYRIERGLDPGEQWVSLKTKEREVSEGLKRSEAELERLKQRLTEVEAALTKAQGELGIATANTVRGIRVKERTGSRHVNGALYIGVVFAGKSHALCNMHVSSDKVDSIRQYLGVGEAISISAGRGKYRVVLTSFDEQGCVFDLVKD